MSGDQTGLSKIAYNAAMRCRLAEIVVFVTICLLVSGPDVNAQSSDSNVACSNSAASDDQPNRPEISIADIIFSGSMQMTVADQEQIANSIMRQTRGTSLDAVMDEGLERVRAGWQDLGYFKVQVTGDTRTLTSSPTTQRIALSVHVDGGSQYKLSSITFKNNKVISSADILRGFFPIADGEIFSREKIASGLAEKDNQLHP